ncbi:hypothetical protein M407DRAFT_7038 [Tulasnella calospora MUT 4182]|uniref:Uncharacterized protein n=1 Tax=Tulasnella calospora MUT 4182 TaxID=1051891 RepID=A0A0C3QM97_9AGAM|nr:hypothetical protein M407DRAFT_7038 [Tulasnella calospora MUT 4182]
MAMLDVPGWHMIAHFFKPRWRIELRRKIQEKWRYGMVHESSQVLNTDWTNHRSKEKATAKPGGSETALGGSISADGLPPQMGKNWKKDVKGTGNFNCVEHLDDICIVQNFASPIRSNATFRKANIHSTPSTPSTTATNGPISPALTSSPPPWLLAMVPSLITQLSLHSSLYLTPTTEGAFAAAGYQRINQLVPSAVVPLTVDILAQQVGNRVTPAGADQLISYTSKDVQQIHMEAAKTAGAAGPSVGTSQLFPYPPAQF